MANHLAIATATEVLRRRLTGAIGTAFPGVQVRAKRPDAADGQSQSEVSIFLYRISANSSLRNHDLATRDAEGRAVRRPTAALDLHYLLSFTGDQQELVPQRMLGLAVASLHSAAALSHAEIKAAEVGGWLGDSDLGSETELVKFSMSMMTLDDLSKLWSVFFQVPYQLSVGYEASVVLIESNLATREALPVGDRAVDALPIRQPAIESVNGGRPLSGDAALEIEISGHRLRGPATLIRFDAGDPQPVTPVNDTRIVVPAAIATALGSGTHTVQVIHEIPVGAQQVPHRAVASNTYRFLLRPTLTLTHPAGGADIVVDFVPPVHEGQSVRLLLNEVLGPPPADRDLRYRELEMLPTNLPAPWAQRSFDVSAIPAGTYLVRARVDDSESQMSKTTGGGATAPAHEVTLP